MRLHAPIAEGLACTSAAEASTWLPRQTTATTRTSLAVTAKLAASRAAHDTSCTLPTHNCIDVGLQLSEMKRSSRPAPPTP